ncbi:MAG: hypothetical protein EPN33_04980 [Acidobacteria bacterium]|nr:MAG: hypothetical protein EPN33_04980 [Acidobacteriota bacterium]
MMDHSHIAELQQAIHRLHGAEARYLKSVAVREEHAGRVVWDGVVEVFELIGHPQANIAYAWSHATDDPAHPKRHVAVLHVPPVTSPETAVRVAIIQEFRNAFSGQAEA